MKILLIFLVIIVLLLIVIAIRRKRKQEVEMVNPYYRKDNFLNNAEQHLHMKLVEAFPEYLVMSQVRLADVIAVKKVKDWQTFFNRISSKSVDFVILDRSYKVLACVELDGKTHEDSERVKADEVKNHALESANIPIYRLKPNQISLTSNLRNTIKI